MNLPITGHDVVIGLDVGTSNVKAVAYRLDGGSTVTCRGAVASRDDGIRHEIDPTGLLRVVEATLRACVEQVVPSHVMALGVSCAMHGLCALGADDNPLTRIVTWADGRASVEADELRDSDWHRRTGTPMHPMAPLPKLVWFARNEPNVVANANRWVDCKALVLHALTDRWVTDVSSASGSGLVLLGESTWSERGCDTAHVRIDQLPMLVPVTERFSATGSLARAVGLEPSCTVVAGAGDGPCANLGVAATSPGIAALSVGTSAAMRVVIDHAAPPDPTCFLYVLDAGRWVTGGALSNGGSVDDWVRGIVAPSMDDAGLDALASSAPPGADGLVMLPYLHPERAPRWDSSIPGALLGLRAHHGPAHLARAAIEGVGVQIALIAESLHAFGQISEVRATGGVFASPLWRATVAAALEQPVTVLGDVEAGALGAAGIALHATGQCRAIEEAIALLVDVDASAVVVEPDPALVAAYRRTRHVVDQFLNAKIAVR